MKYCACQISCHRQCDENELGRRIPLPGLPTDQYEKKKIKQQHQVNRLGRCGNLEKGSQGHECQTDGENGELNRAQRFYAQNFGQQGAEKSKNETKQKALNLQDGMTLARIFKILGEEIIRDPDTQSNHRPGDAQRKKQTVRLLADLSPSPYGFYGGFVHFGFGFCRAGVFPRTIFTSADRSSRFLSGGEDKS